MHSTIIRFFITASIILLSQYGYAQEESQKLISDFRALQLHKWKSVELITTNSIDKSDRVGSDTVSFIFIGDVMGHGAQIESAYNSKTGRYNYDPVFAEISSTIESVDFAVANLEVTLAGKPYMGYPQFSSPDQLVTACTNAGIDAFVTANNHSCDRGKGGVVKTIDKLNKMGIPHTGTFKDSIDREQHNLLIFKRDDIRVGLLNYTYGTNGIEVPKPTIVNLIDTVQMLHDIRSSGIHDLDKLIVSIHWGLEYKSLPSKAQKRVAKFLFRNGVDIIVGSHPHVIQPFEFRDCEDKQELIVYSLGNFVSNQRTAPRDGGAMLQFSIVKDSNGSRVVDPRYHLTWVNKPKKDGKAIFQILPCRDAEADGFSLVDSLLQPRVKTFINSARELLNEHNVGVKEIGVK